jgi:hypothetical protein
MRGTKMRADTFSSPAARATATPWLPPEAATSPPRTRNDLVRQHQGAALVHQYLREAKARSGPA